MQESPEDRLIKLMATQRYDPLGYVRAAYEWGEQDLKGSLGPREWQEDILKDIRNHLQDPLTRHTPIRIAVASGHGIGKAHPLTQIIDTPDGRKLWGELSVGDKVFGSDGKPTRIRRCEKYIDIPIYRVKFNDGSFTDVSEGHLWNVRGRQERRNKREGWRTLGTKEIINLGVQRPNGKVSAKQWEIPIQGIVQYEHREMPLHPYLVGVWLGDGGRNKAAFTSNDPIIAQRIQNLGYEITNGYKEGTTALSYYIKNIKCELKSLGILDKYSYQKSVPVLYMENSPEIRAEILRGLLDTDGEVGKHGSLGFSSSSYALAQDVIWLVRSLGGKASMQPTVKKPFFNDKDGNKKAGRECWRVTIQMPTGFQCFYVEHKQARVKKVEHRYLTRWIQSIVPIGNADAMCIEVEAQDGLYLANDFIVTHNSSLISMIINWGLSTCTDTKIVITANTEQQLRTKTWPEVSKWLRLCITGYWFKDTATSIYSIADKHERTWRADAVTWSENNTDAFAGLHNEGRRLILIFDEGSSIADKVWEVAEGALTDANTEIIWLAFGNPTRNVGRFRECFGRFKHRWIHKQIDSRTVEGTNKVQLQQWIDDYGEDSDFVRVRVKGMFPRAGTMQFIDSDTVAQARKRAPEPTRMDALVMGVDVARFGDDQTVIVLRRGRDAVSIPWIKMRGADTMAVAARIVELSEEYKPDAIFVDGGGVGGGVVDRLRMLKHPVIEVQFGGAADRGQMKSEGQVVYANKRAEMWGMMREWLKGGSIPDVPELEADLCGVEYGYTIKEGKDALILEKKADMKKRGLASPDLADALAVSFAYTVHPSDHTSQLRRSGGGQHQINYDPLTIDYIKKDLSGGTHSFSYDPLSLDYVRKQN